MAIRALMHFVCSEVLFYFSFCIYSHENILAAPTSSEHVSISHTKCVICSRRQGLLEFLQWPLRQGSGQW